MVLSTFLELCSHPHNLIYRYFSPPHLEWGSCAVISGHIHSPASCSALDTPRPPPPPPRRISVPTLQAGPLWTSCISEIIKYMVFCGWLPCMQETTPLI